MNGWHHHDREPEAPTRPVHRAPDRAAPGPVGAAAAGNAALARLLRGAVQRRELGSQGAGPLDPSIAAAIEAQRGSGSPLADPVRTDMEHHLNVDLSAVRVHTGPTATELNRSVQAEAFTTGTDVFFSGGGYDPGSSRGRELLAHELTHVVQQSAGTAGGEGRVSHPDDAAEVHAREVGRTVGVAPVAVAPVGAGPSVDRCGEEEALQRQATGPDTELPEEEVLPL